MNNIKKNGNVINLRIPPAKIDELEVASSQYKEKSRNVFCKKIILFFIELHSEGISFDMLRSAKKEIVKTILRVKK